MAPRVILFVDYQNVHRAARKAFSSLGAPARELPEPVPGGTEEFVEGAP